MVAANVTSYRIANLKAGQTYQFKVRAANGDAFSDYSNVVTVAIPASNALAAIALGCTVDPYFASLGNTISNLKLLVPAAK